MTDPKPFPRAWLERYDYEILERLAIMTVDGEMTDEEAVIEVERLRNENA
ncbi:MAG: hypothetical protein ABFD75_12170 [Smithella sp.]